MFSKFSVLSKFCNYSKFKHNGLTTRLFKNESRSIMPNRSFYTKTQTNSLLTFHKFNTLLKKTKNYTCLKIECKCKMSSIKNEDGKNMEVTAETKKQRGKKQFKRKSKVKGLKKSHINCKRCNANKKGEYKSEGVQKETNLKQHTSLPFEKDKEDLKAHILKPIYDDYSILQRLPPKKVHVEFMESQNLKDFSLTKTPPLSINSNISKQNVIDIKMEPILSNNDQITLNANQMETKNSLISLEIHDVKKSLNIQKNQLLKSQENDLTTDQRIENAVTVNNTSILPKRNSLQKSLSNEVSKKSKNIRILYKAHPRRKIKIGSRKMSKKISQIKWQQQQKEPKQTLLNSTTNTTLETSAFPKITKSGEILSKWQQTNQRNENTSSSPNSGSSRLWRTLSITIFPLILSLTFYVVSNIGAVEMLKRMHNARSIDEPLSIKTWLTSYGTSSETEQLDLNKIILEKNKYEDDAGDPTEIENDRVDIFQFLH